MTSSRKPQAFRTLATACLLTAGMLLSAGAPASAAETAPAPVSDYASHMQGDFTAINLYLLDNDVPESPYVIDHSTIAFVDASGNKSDTITSDGHTYTLVRDTAGKVRYSNIKLDPRFSGETKEVTYGWNSYVLDANGVKQYQGFQTAVIVLQINPSSTAPAPAPVAPKVMSDIGYGKGDTVVSIDIHANDGANINEAATVLYDPATGKPAKEVTVANGTHKLVADADGGFSYQFVPVAGFKGGSVEKIYQHVQDINGLGMTAEIVVEITAVEQASSTPVITPDEQASSTPVITPDEQASSTPVITPDEQASSTPVLTPGEQASSTPVLTKETPEAVEPAIVDAPVVETAPVEVTPAPVEVEEASAEVAPAVASEAPSVVAPASSDIVPAVIAEVVAPAVLEAPVEAPVAVQAPVVEGEGLALTGADTKPYEAPLFAGIGLLFLGAVVALRTRSSKV